VQDGPGRGGTPRRVNLRSVAAAAGLIVLFWFAIVNSQPVKVDYLVGSAEVRLVFVIAGSAILGGLVAAFAGRRRQRRSRS